jgi:hypothetical protein
MIGRIIPILLAATLPTGADDLPSVRWGGSPTEVITAPHLCRGPLEVAEGTELFMCTQSVLEREALVSLYFVDGGYACFSVTMPVHGATAEEARREFDAVVARLQSALSPRGARGDTTGSGAAVTWDLDGETVREAVDATDDTRLIGIVAFADEYRQRVAGLLSW